KITDAQKHEGYGLSHIIDKHPELDLHKIPEIIEKGEVESKNGIKSIVLNDGGKEYRIGLSKGWKGKGENEWILTAYENKKIKENGETFYHDTFTTKEPLENPDKQIIQHT
ncbi:putative barnase/colicin E5 family endoribonuclease, partial [Helicobacter sp. T3_23-1059]